MQTALSSICSGQQTQSIPNNAKPQTWPVQCNMDLLLKGHAAQRKFYMPT